MQINRKAFWAFGLSLALAVLASTTGAQDHHSGGQHTQPGTMMGADQMQNMDAMIAHMNGLLSQMTAMHAGGSMHGAGSMPHPGDMHGTMGPGHDAMVGQMRGMLDLMTQMHGTLGTMMKSAPQGSQHARQMAKDLERMGNSLQSMMKNMQKAMKGGSGAR